MFSITHCLYSGAGVNSPARGAWRVASYTGVIISRLYHVVVWAHARGEGYVRRT